ncbi:MAG: DNA-binding protein [Acholeplasmatales bacterium]|nr:MAG: DNA-binding protein [Acholeplasmatales bacterium]
MIDIELKLYTIEEVTKILKVTQRTVYNYIKSGELKAIKVGKNWRVKHKDLEQFLAHKTQEA